MSQVGQTEIVVTAKRQLKSGQTGAAVIAGTAERIKVRNWAGTSIPKGSITTCVMSGQGNWHLVAVEC